MNFKITAYRLITIASYCKCRWPSVAMNIISLLYEFQSNLINMSSHILIWINSVFSQFTEEKKNRFVLNCRKHQTYQTFALTKTCNKYSDKNPRNVMIKRCSSCRNQLECNRVVYNQLSATKQYVSRLL